MSRYKVNTEFTLDTSVREPIVVSDSDYERHIVVIQVADIIDTQNGQTYRDGAFRVVTALADDGAKLKPFKTGKGGTVPHFGESAWSAAGRDFDDLVNSLRFGR